MNVIREPQRDVPIVCDVDVVVVGGSCTGVFAAVRAARLGMRTAIIEKQNCFGGTATAGAVYVWHSLHDTDGTQQIIGGLTVDTIDRLCKRQAVSVSEDPSTAFRLNTEELKIELDEIILEHDIVPFLHTAYVGPVLENGRLRAVVVENKNGRQAIGGRQFVDATGDGDLARHTGVPEGAQGPLQPPGTCAKIAGMSKLGDVDWQEAVRTHGQEFGLKPDWGWGGALPGLNDIHFRTDSHVFGVNASDADQLTRAEIEGRRQVRALMDLIRTYVPETSDVTLVDLAATIGIRETPRRHARYRLTEHDVLTGRRFPDAIANGSYRVDIHHADGPGITFRYLDGTETTIPERGMLPRHGRWREPLPRDPTFYQIPFRCLLQDSVPNLVLAGRMLDADRGAFSAVRVMVNMNQTGEAAGAACALAIQGTQDVVDVNPDMLRETLKNGGSVCL